MILGMFIGSNPKSKWVSRIGFQLKILKFFIFFFLFYIYFF